MMFKVLRNTLLPLIQFGSCHVFLSKLFRDTRCPTERIWTLLSLFQVQRYVWFVPPPPSAVFLRRGWAGTKGLSHVMVERPWKKVFNLLMLRCRKAAIKISLL